MPDYIPRNIGDKPRNRYDELEQIWEEMYGDIDYPGFSEDLYDSLYTVKTANKLPEGSLSGVQNQGVTAMRPEAERYGSQPMQAASTPEGVDREKQRQTWAANNQSPYPMRVNTNAPKELDFSGGVNNLISPQISKPNVNAVQGATRYTPTEAMTNMRGLSPEQVNINKTAFQKMHPGYDAQGHDKYGSQRSTPMSRARNAAGYFNQDNMNDLNMRNASMGLIDMGDTSELQRMGLSAKPQAQQTDTRRQDYLSRVANKPLPQRDMRDNPANSVSPLTKYD